MTPEQKLLKAFQLSTVARKIFMAGLRKRFPDASEEEFREILKDELLSRAKKEKEIYHAPA
jgi:hypothetical protein